MRKLSYIAAALFMLVAPAVASAQVQKLTLGARLGYAKAGGDAEKDAKMSDGISGAIPIQLEAGYLVMPELSVGAYFGYGFGRVGGALSDECDTNHLDCSASVVRLGVQALWSFEALNPQFVPWFGAGIGWERGHAEESLNGQYVKITYTGWELLHLQAGADYRVTPALRAGPYLGFSFNRYGSFKGESKLGGVSNSQSGDVASSDKTTHTFFNIGLRGEFRM